jgi:hypothetical protein
VKFFNKIIIKIIKDKTALILLLKEVKRPNKSFYIKAIKGLKKCD